MRVLKFSGWVVLGICGASALALLIGFPVMWLWNALLPPIFGFKVIGYWQSVGLLVLSHLLFKSHGHGPHHRHGSHGKHCCHHDHLRERLAAHHRRCCVGRHADAPEDAAPRES